MRVIKIEEAKKEKMSEHAEKALHHLGKLMTCLEGLDEGGYGERDYDGYGMRRRSSRTGRYMR